MRSKIVLTGMLAGLVLIWSLCACLAESPAQTGTKPTKKAPPNETKSDSSPDPASVPLSMAKLLEQLLLMRDGTQTQGRLLVLIDTRGVDFPATEENLATLAGKGASEPIVEAIRRK